MLKPKYTRPIDQREQVWTNTDTMVTDNNDDKEHQIHGYTDCPSDQSLSYLLLNCDQADWYYTSMLRYKQTCRCNHCKLLLISINIAMPHCWASYCLVTLTNSCRDERSSYKIEVKKTSDFSPPRFKRENSIDKLLKKLVLLEPLDISLWFQIPYLEAKVKESWLWPTGV